MSIVKFIVSKTRQLASKDESCEPGSIDSPSISNRLNSILRVSTGIMLISFVLFSGYTVISKYQDTIQRMRSLASILAINSEAPLIFSDRPSAEENLHSLSAIAEVSGAGIVKSNGDTLAVYVPAPNLAQNLPGTVQNLLHRVVTGRLRLEQPVFAPTRQEHPVSESSRQVIGWVWIEADLTGDWLKLATVLGIFIPVMFGIYGLGRILNNRLAYSVVKPLEELAQTALEIGQNRNYDRRLLLWPGITELNAVVDGFNQMLEQIQLRDVELQNRRDLLEQYNEELKDFSYIVSHDLRAPMINVQGFVNELSLSLNDLRKVLDAEMEQLPEHKKAALLEILNEDIPTSARFITGGVAKMNQLLAGILKISRLGRQELNISVIDVQHLVDDNIEAIKYQSDQAGAEFQVQSLPQVQADPELLDQIFANLLSNAVKYLDKKRAGKIEIWAVDQGEHFRFFVKDNGLGVAEKDQKKIFEMFRRGNNHAVEGEGVGLNYVKSAIKRLGGTISLESVAGQGSSFSFTLPKR
ncbi:MAG: ATP-binding protein [Methylobacter sp.]|uniref:ATP-binding protein n=1 Tax=Methylobacter sp. TaxID=2051955 RepID=UPI00272F5ED4|nr:ATP-binding protein [Methylobacter sp.]MDP1667322.1 ATP-binding protein [Methylobacter sp.]